MKKILNKKTISLTLAALMCATSSAVLFSSCSGNYVAATKHDAPKEVYALTFDNAIGKDVMPVGVYAGPHAGARTYKGQSLPSMVSKEYFDLYKEMDFNFFTATLDSKTGNVEEFLSLCDEYNMGAFLTFDELFNYDKAPFVTVEKIESNLGQFAENHKSLLGFNLRDEPTKSMIDALKNTRECLANSVYADTMYAYGNALPEYAGASYYWDGGAAKWEVYLDYYCENLDLGYLSYDYYPWMIKQDGTESYKTGYIKSLSVARKVANKHKIPLWSFKQCGSIFETELYPMSVQKFLPNENKFRWQMAIDLVYGVKGIQYFLLCGDALLYDELIWEPGIDDYFGIFNAYTGQPNRWFYYAKDFNAHLRKIQGVLMNSYHDGIIVNGKVMEQGYIGDELIKSGTYHELTGVEGDASWVGCYNYNGQTVLYVMNDSFEKNGQVTLNFSDKYGYTVYQQTNVTDKAGKKLTLDLLPGEGAMVMLKYE